MPLLWVYDHYIFLTLSVRGSTLDVILTSKVDPRAERVNPCAAGLFASIFHSLN